MFVTRLISGVVLVAIALVTIGLGNWVLFATLLLVSLIGARELYQAMKVSKKGFSLLELGGYAGIILYYLGMVFLEEKFHLAAILAGLVILMFIYVFRYPEYHAHQVMAAFFGIVYVGVMLSCVYQARMLPGGHFHVWLIFLCSWGCDTCAYCAGMLFGKHKMAPVLSPKKSVEGAVGGRGGSRAAGSNLRGGDQRPCRGVRGNLRRGSSDLHGGGSGGFRC